MRKTKPKRWFDQLRAAIRDHIDEQGITATAFAKNVGIPQPQLSLLLNAKHVPNLDLVQRLCEAINFRFE